jgi:tetratricopeptide (TPR) repeat protein
MCEGKIFMISTIAKTLLVLTAALFIIGCPSGDKTQSARFIETAREMMAQDKPQEAIIAYRNAIQEEPDNEVALFELAEVYTVVNQFETAMRFYHLAAGENPENILPLRRLAQIHLANGQLLEARNYVNQVFALEPQYVPAHHILADIQIRERDQAAAIDTLKNAAAIDPENIDTHIRLARIHIQAGDNQNAEIALEKIIAIDPSHQEACLTLAELYVSTDRPLEAEHLLTSIAETPGAKALKLTNLARFMESRGRYDEAEDGFQDAVDAAPDDVFTHLNLAGFYTRRNQKDQALNTMEIARALEKETHTVLTEMGRIYRHFGMIQEAEKAIDTVLRQDDTFVAALFEKGRVLMAKKNVQRALDLFETAIYFDRSHARAYYYRALCIQQGGATDRANQKIFRAAAGLLDDPTAFEKDQIKASLQVAVALDPTLMDARMRLIEIYLLEQDVKNAKEELNQVLAFKAPDMRLLTLQAAVHILENDFAAAEDLLQKMMAEKPEHIPTYVRLGALTRAMGKQDQAMDLLRTAHEKAPENLGLIRMMAEIYVENKKFGQALGMVDLLQQKTENRADAFFENLKGEIYLSKGEIRNALVHFEAAVENDAEYISPRLHAARIYHRTGDVIRALAHYQAVEQLDPKHEQALMAIGFIHDAAARYDLAETYYRKVLEISPGNPNAANNLAFVLSEQPEHLEEAFRLAVMAKEKMSKNPQVMDTLGWIHYQKGNYMSARSELEESLNIYPDSALASFHYGMTLYQLKEYEKARSFLSRALSLNDSFKGADTARKVLN